MDLYNVLELNKDATDKDIKESYKRLVKMYHPDKNSAPDAAQRFIEIQSAYSILSDKHKRKEYDTMTVEEQGELYGLVKGYLVKNAPNFVDIYDLLVKKVYGDEDDLKKDVNNFDIKGIYKKLYSVFTSKKKPSNNKVDKEEVKQIDNVPQYIEPSKTLHTSFEDRYLNRYKKIMINGTKSYNIPLRETEITIPKGGRFGNDLVINIECKPPNGKFSKIQLIDEYHIATTVPVSIYEYFYGGEVSVELPGDSVVSKFGSFADKAPLLRIAGKGLPYLDDDSEDDSDSVIDSRDNIKRGDLFVYFKIKDLNKEFTKESLRKLFST